MWMVKVACVGRLLPTGRCIKADSATSEKKKTVFNFRIKLSHQLGWIFLSGLHITDGDAPRWWPSHHFKHTELISVSGKKKHRAGSKFATVGGSVLLDGLFSLLFFPRSFIGESYNGSQGVATLLIFRYENVDWGRIKSLKFTEYICNWFFEFNSDDSYNFLSWHIRWIRTTWKTALQLSKELPKIEQFCSHSNALCSVPRLVTCSEISAI